MMPAEETAAPISIARALQLPWEKAAAQAVLQPWIAAFVGLHVFVMLGGIGSIWFLKTRLDSLSGSATVIARQTTDLSSRVGDLTDQAQSIKMEGTELRQYVASSSAEQVIFLKILVLKPDVDLVLARNIARQAHRYGALYKRDPDLVLAIIAEESRFNPEAVSPVGAVGLMQVMPQWEKVLGIQGSLKDPEVSIKYGMQVLGFYMEMYKDIEMALTAYNRGPGPVDMALMRGKNPKNGYAPQVLKVYERLKSLSIPSGPT
ncbi:MAG: lytic transglycosylase domain-containing protein [Deltaproteobacteria bacterium]|nr:MAG: lytic transglycosylase domain-containing protein [Deltaproteobacteria bacterium]